MLPYSQLNPEHFVQRDCVIGGDECVLIFPNHIGCDWDLDTLWYRSIILRKSDGRVVSVGQRKFFNSGEKPYLYPNPEDFHGWVVWDKLDGSLCIVSRHNGELIVRTRGTADCSVHETGDEMRQLVNRYKVVDHHLINGHSFLFEHVTPSHPIVIRYPEPDLVLLDVVAHEWPPRYLSEMEVDDIAVDLGCRRPARFSFDTVSQIVETCRTLKGREGYVLAYNFNRDRVKLKADDYLLKHRLKSEIGSLSKLLDMWFALGYPTVQGFYDHISTQLDFELAEQAKPQIEQIIHAHEEAYADVHEIHANVLHHRLREKPRKEAALWIVDAYQGVDRQLAFFALDNKAVPDKILRTMIEDSLAAQPQTLTDVAGLAPGAFVTHLKECPPDVSPDQWKPSV